MKQKREDKANEGNASGVPLAGHKTRQARLTLRHINSCVLGLFSCWTRGSVICIFL